MAPKRPNPMEEPPAASSSDEEEEEEEQEDSSGSEVKVSSSSSDDDGEEEEKDSQDQDPATAMSQKTQKQPALKKSEATAQTKAPTSESESESESGSEPAASPKPIDATKPRSSKRPNEAENKEAANAKDSKRAKKNGGGDEEQQKKEPGEDTKKQQPPLFQRLWSEDDEIIVLKRMIDYSTEKGLDPSQDTQAFYDYVKNSLHGDYTKAQLVDKIRRLKKKCVNNLRKSAKKGGVRTFSNPHEQRAYDLSKKLWGGSEESADGVIASSAAKSYKKNQSQKGNNELLAALKAELLGEEGAVGDKKGNAAVLFDKTLGVAGLEEFVLRDGFDVISGEKKAELEQRWKNLQIAQLKLFLQRNELIKEQALLILEATRKTTQ